MLQAKRLIMAKKNQNVVFTKNYNFRIEQASSSIAGFGESVYKIIGIYSQKTKCYINEQNQIYFPNPIGITDLKDLVCFLNEFCEMQDAQKVV